MSLLQARCFQETSIFYLSLIYSLQIYGLCSRCSHYCYMFKLIFRKFFSYHEWKQLFTQKCATNYQSYLENQFNKFLTWNNIMLMKYHTGDSAEWIRIIWAEFSGQMLGTPRLTALKLFPETVFSSDHNNNLKWVIAGT
jgi:hypothetical protein